MAKHPAEIRSLARAYAKRGIQILGGLAETGESEEVRVRAIGMLFDRGYGKPSQEIKHVGAAEDGSHTVIIRHITEGAKAPKK